MKVYFTILLCIVFGFSPITTTEAVAAALVQKTAVAHKSPFELFFFRDQVGLTPTIEILLVVGYLGLLTSVAGLVLSIILAILGAINRFSAKKTFSFNWITLLKLSSSILAVGAIAWLVNLIRLRKTFYDTPKMKTKWISSLLIAIILVVGASWFSVRAWLKY